METLFEPLVSITGASTDQIKLITCLLVSYPLGSVFIRIPQERHDLKHLFNIGISLFYLIAILNLWSGSAQLIASALGTYYLSAYIKNARMPWVVFAFTMGHLTINHTLRAIYGFSYETFEITAPQMVLTMKLTTFAWNVFDGRRPVEELDKWQKEKRVAQHPSILEFLGYVFFFPGLLVGPCIEFADYMNLIEGTVFKSILKEEQNGGSNRKRLVPKGRKRAAYRKMLLGLTFLAIFVVYGPDYTFGAAVEDDFARKNIASRLAWFQFYGFIERTKYYAIWILTEGAAILTGFGFTGYGPSGETRWDGASNINIMSIEFAPNIKVLLDSWNMKTNVWLRECVYKRVTPKGKKPGFKSSLTTFTASAFWHGIAGGYYLAFLTGAFVQTVGRLCRNYVRPLLLPADYITSRTAPPPPQTPLKRAYDIIGIICAVMMMNYMACAFMLLTLEKGLIAWSRVWWYGSVWTGGALLVLYGGGIRMLSNIQKQRRKRAGVTIERPTPAPAETPVSVAEMADPLDDLAQQIEAKADFAANLK